MSSWNSAVGCVATACSCLGVPRLEHGVWGNAAPSDRDTHCLQGAWYGASLATASLPGPQRIQTMYLRSKQHFFQSIRLIRVSRVQKSGDASIHSPRHSILINSVTKQRVARHGERHAGPTTKLTSKAGPQREATGSPQRCRWATTTADR